MVLTCRTLVTTEECLLHANRREVDGYDKQAIEKEFKKLLSIEKVDIMSYELTLFIFLP